MSEYQLLHLRYLRMVEDTKHLNLKHDGHEPTYYGIDPPLGSVTQMMRNRQKVRAELEFYRPAETN